MEFSIGGIVVALFVLGWFFVSGSGLDSPGAVADLGVAGAETQAAAAGN